MSTFKVEIDLGNAAMRTPFDVGAALMSLGHKLAAESDWHDEMETGRIRDLNGNTVGLFALEKDE